MFALVVMIGALASSPHELFAQGPLPIPSARACPNSLDFIIPGTHDQFVSPWDVIWAEYMRIGGPEGPIGCPLGGFVKDAADGGGFMQFEHGQIAVSPSVWKRGVVAAYQDGSGIMVDWNVSLEDPPQFTYNKFLVRWDFRKGLKFEHFDDVSPKPCERGTGDQCDILEDMTDVQVVLIHYFHDTHLNTKGTFGLPTDHGFGKYKIIVEGCDEPKVGKSKCRQGWMHPVEVDLRSPGVYQTDYTIDLSDVPSASDVDSSKAALFKRAAAYTRSNACSLLPHSAYRHEENYMQVIMAKLDYANYYKSDLMGDHCPGREVANRQEAIQSLAQQRIESKSGTSRESCPLCRTGEYDVALSGYIPILYRFGNVLPAAVYNHILNDLLNKRGPLDVGDHSVEHATSETENHINMIESSRYLTNDLLFLRTRDPKFDNSKNTVMVSPQTIEGEQIPPGVDTGPNALPFPVTMRDYWLRRLHHILQSDFIEYNARPYQDYTMHSIQNLYSFARDPQVKAAAGMVLNYVYAKLAASSNDNRRSVPFRRRAEANNPNLLGWQSDAQAGRMLILAGDLSILAQTGLSSSRTGQRGVMSPWYDQDQWTIQSAYTIPDPILDVILNSHHRLYYQGLHHYADEVYAASPSFLISAGGHYATYAYTVAGIGDHNDIGLALPTTVMPTGLYLSRNELMRFEGDSDDTKRSNMCVAPGFACGITPRLPDGLNPHLPAKFTLRDGCVVEKGPWTFINFTPACRKNDSVPYGFYAALFQQNEGGVTMGFVEVFDTRVNALVTFEEFWQGERGVLARTQGRTFHNKSSVYVTTTGQEITFETVPDSLIVKIANGPAPVQSTTNMAMGTILQSDGSAGLITITNPFTGWQLTMDDRDPFNPMQGLAKIAAYDDNACLPSFVWREAGLKDHVCVTADQRRETQSENGLAATRRSPTGGPFGPGTCKQGFVWREAFAGDHVCVPSASRAQAAWDNKLAPNRYAAPPF